MKTNLRFHIRNTKSGTTRHQHKSLITIKRLCNIISNIFKPTVTFKILNIIYITFMPSLINSLGHVSQRTTNICKYNSMIMRPTGILAELGNNKIAYTAEIRHTTLTNTFKPKLNVSL